MQKNYTILYDFVLDFESLSKADSIRIEYTFSINNQRFRRRGHAVRMDEDAPPRRGFDAVVGGHRRVGQPHTHWKDQEDYRVLRFESNLLSKGIQNTILLITVRII